MKDTMMDNSEKKTKNPTVYQRASLEIEEVERV